MDAQIILGVAQGIFEWIPISSEGVVALVSQFLNKGFNPVDLALFLHLGTLLAIFIYFRDEWKEVLMFKNIELLRFLVITTIVSLPVGFLFYKIIGDVAVGSFLLAVMGFALLITAYFQKKEKKLNIGPNKLAVITGFVQGLAVIPGLSRSGSTIFSLSLGKDDPNEILKISYMMSAPAVMASSVFLILDSPGLALSNWPALIFSFLAGLLSLHFLIDISRRIKFFHFAFIFGILCLIGAVI